MKDINLIPDKIIYKRKLAVESFFRIVITVAVIVTLIALLSFRTIQRISLEHQLKDLVAMIDTKSIKLYDDASKELSELKKTEASIDEALSQLPQQGANLSLIIKEYASAMPSTIRVTSMVYIRSEAALKMNMTASSRQDISEFLELLRRKEVFSNIILSEIRGSLNNFDFTVELNMIE